MSEKTPHLRDEFIRDVKTGSRMCRYSNIRGVGMGSSAQCFLPVSGINFCTSCSQRGSNFSSLHKFVGLNLLVDLLACVNYLD